MGPVCFVRLSSLFLCNYTSRAQHILRLTYSLIHSHMHTTHVTKVSCTYTTTYSLTRTINVLKRKAMGFRFAFNFCSGFFCYHLLPPPSRLFDASHYRLHNKRRHHAAVKTNECVNTFFLPERKEVKKQCGNNSLQLYAIHFVSNAMWGYRQKVTATWIVVFSSSLSLYFLLRFSSCPHIHTQTVCTLYSRLTMERR